MWDEDECDNFAGGNMAEADLRKLKHKLSTDGYRFGKAKADEEQMQVRFNAGFERGILIGKACGGVYAAVRLFTTHNRSKVDGKGGADPVLGKLAELERLLFEKLPESDLDLNDVVSEIGDLVLTISKGSLSPAVADFKHAMEAASGQGTSKLISMS